PAARHALWLVVLIKLMTPPLFSWPWPAPWRNLDWPSSIATSQETRDSAGISLDAGEPAPPILKMCGPQIIATAAGEVTVSQGIETPLAPRRGWISSAPSLCPGIETSQAPRRGRIASPSSFLPEVASLTPWLVPAWLVVTGLLAVGQSIRIVRF